MIAGVKKYYGSYHQSYLKAMVYFFELLIICAYEWKISRNILVFWGIRSFTFLSFRWKDQYQCPLEIKQQPAGSSLA